MYTKPLILVQLPTYKWRVYMPFEYRVNINGNAYQVKIPKGYVTDLASIPRAFWWFISPAGRHSQACVVHDYMYEKAILTKKIADEIFYEGLLELGVPKWRAKLMYTAVKLFGKGKYVK